MLLDTDEDKLDTKSSRELIVNVNSVYDSQRVSDLFFLMIQRSDTNWWAVHRILQEDFYTGISNVIIEYLIFQVEQKYSDESGREWIKDFS